MHLLLGLFISQVVVVDVMHIITCVAQTVWHFNYVC